MIKKKTTEMTRVAPDWEVSIKRAENGFIVTSYEEMHGCDDDNQIYKKAQYVIEDGAFFEEIESLSAEYQSLIDDHDVAMYFLLHHIAEHFGCHYSKHKKINLYVDFVVKEDDDGMERK